MIAPGFWDTHFLSINPTTGTFRVDTKAPLLNKAAFDESLIPEEERIRIGTIEKKAKDNKIPPELKWTDYLRWNEAAGVERPVTTVERVLDLEDIRFIFERAMKEAVSLPNESLSSEQKILMLKRLNDFAGSLDIKLTQSYDQAPLVKLIVKNSSMIEEEIEVPLSLGAHSAFLRHLFFSPFHQGAAAGAGNAAPATPSLILPDTFTLDDFKLYLLTAAGKPLPEEKPTVSDAIRMLLLFEYFDDSTTAEKFAKILTLNSEFITIDHVSEILQLCQEGRLQVSSPAVQKALSSCVNALIKQAQIQEGGLEKTLSDLLEGPFSKVTGFCDLGGYSMLAQLPLQLSLSGALTDRALEKLSILFPNVASLDLSHTRGITLLPARWDNSLKHLDISGTGIERINRPLPSLESFKASIVDLFHRGILSDISGLNGLTRLKTIDVSRTRVRAAPAGCTALESFIASCAETLTDISGLNGLTQLKSINISSTNVRAAPIGCTALIRFSAAGCELLTDVRGLLESSKLFYTSLPVSIPTDIKKLFIDESFALKMRSLSNEERLALFRGLAPNVQNRLKWFFWLFSGMPEGDPEFGTHLFETNPRDPAVEKTLRCLCNSVVVDIFNDEIKLGDDNTVDINRLHTILQDSKSSDADKREALSSIDLRYRELILHSIWVACGSDLSADPEFAENLVKDNPSAPVIKQVVAKFLSQISS